MVTRNALNVELEVRFLGGQPNNAVVAQLAEARSRDGRNVSVRIRPTVPTYILVHGFRYFDMVFKISFNTL